MTSTHKNPRTDSWLGAYASSGLRKASSLFRSCSQVVRQRSAKSLHLFRSCLAISQEVAPRRRSETARSRRVARVRSDPAVSTHKNPHSTGRAERGGERDPRDGFAGELRHAFDSGRNDANVSPELEDQVVDIRRRHGT